MEWRASMPVLQSLVEVVWLGVIFSFGVVVAQVWLVALWRKHKAWQDRKIVGGWRQPTGE